MVATSITVDTERLSSLVGLGYELPLGSAAADPVESRDAARAFVEYAAEVFPCQLAALEYADANDPGHSLVVAGGLDGFEEVFRSARSLEIDDTFLARMRRRPSGTVLLGSEIVAPADMRRSASYLTLAKPWRLEHFLIGCVLNNDSACAWFALGRSREERPFLPGDKEVLRRLLLSHLTRSVTIQREVGAARSATSLLEAFFHQAPSGIVIFNAQGKATVVSEKSAAIFAAADGLGLVDGRLRADEPSIQAALDSSLSAMLRLTEGVTQPAPVPPAIRVPRRGNRRPYRVTFSALGWPGGRRHGPPGSAVLVTIHEERERCMPTVLRATYGLTDAEGRLCDALAAGQTLLEAAQSLAVSRNTAKTHLARIFDKTGVRSQGALVRLLVAGPRH